MTRQSTLRYKVHVTQHDDSHDDELTLEQSLALIEGETRGVKRAFGIQVPIYYFVWGTAWLLGYLLLWAAWEGGPSPVTVPLAIAVPVFAALILGAAVTSAVVGIRSNRGVKGPSDFVGTVYGISWSILGGAVAAIGYAMINAGASNEAISIYFTSAYALVVAAMYLAGAMLWHDVDLLVIAVIMAATAAITGFFGAPGNMLGTALIAGCTLLVGGVIAVIRYRRM